MTTKVVNAGVEPWINGTKKTESLLEYQMPNKTNNNQPKMNPRMQLQDLPPPPDSPALSLRDTHSPLPPTPPPPVQLSPPQPEPALPLPPKQSSRENLTQIHGTVPIRKKLEPLIDDDKTQPLSGSLDDLLSRSPRRRPLRSVGSPIHPDEQSRLLSREAKSSSVDFDILADAKTPLTNTSARILRHSSERKSPPAKPPRESLRRSKVRQEHPCVQNVFSHLNSPVTTTTVVRTPIAVKNPIVPSGSFRGRENGNNNVRSVRPISLLQSTHDYEELPNNKTKRVNSTSMAQDGFILLHSSQHFNQNLAPEKPPHPRNYYPPPPAVMTTPSSYSPPAITTSTKITRSRKAPARCLWCLITSIVIAIILALSAIAVACLLLFGIIKPLNEAVEGDLAPSLELLMRDRLAQKQQVNNLEIQVNRLLNSSAVESDSSKQNFEQAKIDLINAVKKMNYTIFDKEPTDVDEKRCQHQTYFRGSSSIQAETQSGDYYAEDGYVMTGVSCSTSSGYVANLHSRIEDLESADNGEITRTVYWCLCTKLINLLDSRRVECRIHYWQCPIM